MSDEEQHEPLENVVEILANVAADYGALREITRLREENARLHKQAEMNGRLLTENAELREENARLREALKPFAYIAEQVGDEDARWAVPSAYLRAARAVIREGGTRAEAACREPDEAP